MNEKMINDLSSIAVKAVSILDELRNYGLCEEDDFRALINIRNKAVGASKLALYLFNESKNVCASKE